MILMIEIKKNQELDKDESDSEEYWEGGRVTLTFAVFSGAWAHQSNRSINEKRQMVIDLTQYLYTELHFCGNFSRFPACYIQ